MPKRLRYKPSPPGKKRTRKSRNQDLAGFSRKQWQTLTRLKKEQNPLCEACEADTTRPNTGDTDHVIPRAYLGSFAAPENLVRLCKVCHGIKSQLEQVTQAPLVPWILDEAGDRVPERKTDLFELLRQKRGYE